MEQKTSFWILLLFFFLARRTSCVNVHFENKDGGFFLKQLPRQHFQPVSASGSDLEPSSTSPGTLLSVDRFTVFQSSQPISVRATYGPFSTKQTVPARYVVPDPFPLNATGPVVDLQELATHHLDMSAHVVRGEIPQDSPVLRVLFHAGTDPSGRRQVLFARHHQVCIVLHAVMVNRAPLSAACSPDGEDGVCLAQIVVPASWWPPLPSLSKDGRLGKASKSPPRLVQLSYSVQEPRPESGKLCQPQMQMQPTTALGLVPLVPAKGAYKELQLGDALRMLIPHPPLFPLSLMHVPVFLECERAKTITAVVIRGRVRSGVRLLGATVTDPSAWNISIEVNPRHTGATVTVLRKEPQSTEAASNGEVMEIFTWLLEITEEAAEPYEDAKITWSARFEPQEDSEAGDSQRSESKKATTRLDIQKDDIQAVVPISKNWEVLNTAVLTGRQVSQAMKVFIVSQAGKAADVTFQASCHSEDDSVLKVSSSCSSVYVDGSEARGSVNGSVLVKYGTYTGLARFTVWMPEFPLDLQVPDTRLSQLKSWKVPDYQTSGTKIRRKKRSAALRSRRSSSSDDMGNVIERPNCRLRYQQSSVDVYAHFMAMDHDSGRVMYLINRRTWLRVTDLVLSYLRVSDPRIASLHGRILQGRSMGRTEVQVLSPINGRVIGAKEVRVGNDKVGITKLSVQVVSGLQLNISPDSSIENGYVAETSVTRKLTAQYQEGLLDIEMEFSDGSKTPLRDVADSDYHLVVESLDPEVVAFAPMVASHHPRVIAVGEGSGDLLHVTLLLSEECRVPGRTKSKGPGPLASASATVTVDFSVSDLPHRPDILQNDGGSYSTSKGRDFHDLQDILKGSSLNDEDAKEPNVQARQYKGGKNVIRQHAPSLMTPLEISMYVLLAAFCFAIVVFVVSCVVYASKFKPADVGIEGLRAAPVATPSNGNSSNSRDNRKPRETTTNAHDWVWLGRATLEHGSNRNSTVTNPGEIRITANPLNMNYCDPEDCVPNSFSNPTHIQLPPAQEPLLTSGRQLDTSTYCKSKSNGQGVVNLNNSNGDMQIWNKPTPPPPLPPHAVPLLPAVKVKQMDEAEDYRPPVPPHRNIGVSTQMLDESPRRHHHHRHYHNGINKKRDHLKDDGGAMEAKPLKNIFEFDDEPSTPSNTPIKMQVNEEPPARREDVAVEVEVDADGFGGDEEGDDDDGVEFVEFSTTNEDGNPRNSAEVKRATIVGNPMFSATETEKEEETSNNDLGGLDGLQLEMDYDQIMHYFENLKESNA